MMLSLQESRYRKKSSYRIIYKSFNTKMHDLQTILCKSLKYIYVEGAKYKHRWEWIILNTKYATIYELLN